MTPREVVARKLLDAFPGAAHWDDQWPGVRKAKLIDADVILAALRDAGCVVLTEAEVAAREAAAVMREREGCIALCRAEANDCDKPGFADVHGVTAAHHYAIECRHLANRIAARPAPAGADALAALLAQARREGIEEAARDG